MQPHTSRTARTPPLRMRFTRSFHTLYSSTCSSAQHSTAHNCRGIFTQLNLHYSQLNIAVQHQHHVSSWQPLSPNHDSNAPHTRANIALAA
jgi:hypothetical protein